ncbi:MAG: DUF3226 domain-containing protein [Thermococci archaeon]|nr:DUF3226 domain-containing protein [Thermococci archaeon]
MRVITGSNYTRFAGNSPILFPEYGKNGEELSDFVSSLEGDETVVTSSLELIDLIASRFRGGGETNTLVYSETGKSLELREVYDLRRKLELDPRGGFTGDDAPASVLFVEGKTDAKFFKAIYKKLFGFSECRQAPLCLKPIERVFRRDNFDLMRRDDGHYVAVIPSEGNSGVITNLRNFLRAMDVFDLKVGSVGVAVDIDEGSDRAMDMIENGLADFGPEKAKGGYTIGDVSVVPLLIGLPFRHELIDWEKPTIEDLMLHLMKLEGLFDRMLPAIEALDRPLKPKEAMYIGLAVYGYWGNLEGFYELFVMRSRFRNLKNVLRRSGLMGRVRHLVPSHSDADVP